MSKKRKLLEKILTSSKNIRFDDFITLLEAFGYVLKRVSGSHHIYRHPDVPEVLSIQPDKNGQVKPYQLKAFLKQVEENDLQLDEGGENGT